MFRLHGVSRRARRVLPADRIPTHDSPSAKCPGGPARRSASCGSLRGRRRWLSTANTGAARHFPAACLATPPLPRTRTRSPSMAAHRPHLEVTGGRVTGCLHLTVNSLCLSGSRMPSENGRPIAGGRGPVPGRSGAWIPASSVTAPGAACQGLHRAWTEGEALFGPLRAKPISAQCRTTLRARENASDRADARADRPQPCAPARARERGT